MEIYLDNSATTRCADEAAELMRRILCEDYGNPSSLHRKGVEAEQYLRYARETFARLLKVKEKELLFTSGGTESDNLALIGAAMAYKRAGMHLVTSRIEHPAVLETMEYLKDQGFEVTYLPVDAYGRVRLADLASAIRPDTILVSIMHTNNELGSLQPIAEAGTLIKEINPHTLFHVDAVQGFGKARILPKRLKVDLMSASSHKIHGPKGVGLLYVGEQVRLRPIAYGGGQQRGLRSGTENVPGIAGMAKAAELLYEHLDEEVARLYALKEQFIAGVTTIPDVSVNGLTGTDSAPHIVSVSFRGVRSEVLLHALEEKGIYVSSGSACSSNKPDTAGSATLRAIGLERALMGSTLRFSTSVYTTQEEIGETVEALRQLLPRLRRFQPG